MCGTSKVYQFTVLYILNFKADSDDFFIFGYNNNSNINDVLVTNSIEPKSNFLLLIKIDGRFISCSTIISNHFCLGMWDDNKIRDRIIYKDLRPGNRIRPWCHAFPRHGLYILTPSASEIYMPPKCSRIFSSYKAELRIFSG